MSLQVHKEITAEQLRRIPTGDLVARRYFELAADAIDSLRRDNADIRRYHRDAATERDANYSQILRLRDEIEALKTRCAVSEIDADPPAQEPISEISTLTVPLNRVLSEGDLPCAQCGSGRSDHVNRDHQFRRRR